MDKYTPVRLSPVFKDYLWGGTRLKTEFNKKTDIVPLAESWELSCHKDGESVICGGEHDGMTLNAYIDMCGRDILGTNAEKFDYFPILIKFIDADKDLSVQVHPDDEYALKNAAGYGKTEMWYVLEAKDNASLYCGLNRDVSRAELEEYVKNGRICEILNKETVKRGDVFFIPSGTLHAICGGAVICEIQQNSNLTYRVYDYGRRGKDGKLRPLHIKEAIEVADIKKAKPQKQSKAGVLAECEYFKTVKKTVSGREKSKIDKTSFVSIIVADGCGRLIYRDAEFAMNKGDSFFVPAQDETLETEGKCELIITTV